MTLIKQSDVFDLSTFQGVEKYQNYFENKRWPYVGGLGAMLFNPIRTTNYSKGGIIENYNKEEDIIVDPISKEEFKELEHKSILEEWANLQNINLETLESNAISLSK